MRKMGRKCLAAKGKMTDERHEMLHSDRHRDLVLIVEGHFIPRHPSEDGTYIPHACGWQHVYNKTWAKPLLYISITAQLYRHVTLITLFCRSAVPQHQAPVSLQCVSAVVFIGIKKKYQTYSLPRQSILNLLFSTVRLLFSWPENNRGAKRMCCFSVIPFGGAVATFMALRLAKKCGKT